MRLELLYGMEQQAEQKPLRYVLYARKSSEDAEAQAKSLPDQIADCQKYARDNGLNIVETIQESKSAKKSGNRPLFTQMIKDIERGKYDGILAWNPDRLARNSLESGMIVDMIDNGIIKDLKFPTHVFSNDSSGKLLLNITFAMAKQYSEHLSESVQRGVDSSFEQGKSGGIPKWGYNRNDMTGLYEPDDNFPYIQRGWEMMIEGYTRNEIVKYWNEHNVHRMTKLTRKNKHIRRIDITENMTTKIFHDPFYYGLLVQGGRVIDLREVNPNFKPMITEEQYNEAQEMTKSRTRKNVTIPISSGKRVFLPFRHLIFCKECGSPMIVCRSKGRNGLYYVNARCDNKECPREHSSCRIKPILEQIYEDLDRLEFTEEEYNKLLKGMKEYVDTKMNDLIIEKRSLNGAKTQKSRKIDELAANYSNLDRTTPEVVRSKLRTEIETLQDEIISIDTKIEQINEQIVDPDSLKITQENFLKQLNSASLKMRSGDPVEKDILARKLYLKLEIDNKNKLTIRYREPFNLLVKNHLNGSGARDRT